MPWVINKNIFSPIAGCKVYILKHMDSADSPGLKCKGPIGSLWCVVRTASCPLSEQPVRRLAKPCRCGAIPGHSGHHLPGGKGSSIPATLAHDLPRCSGGHHHTGPRSQMSGHHVPGGLQRGQQPVPGALSRLLRYQSCEGYLRGTSGVWKALL